MIELARHRRKCNCVPLWKEGRKGGRSVAAIKAVEKGRGKRK
jgi:hypothetical protein